MNLINLTALFQAISMAAYLSTGQASSAIFFALSLAATITLSWLERHKQSELEVLTKQVTDLKAEFQGLQMRLM